MANAILWQNFFFSVHYIYLLQKIIETDVNRYAICVWALIQWHFTIIVILIKVRSDYRALIYRCMIHVDCTYYDWMIYLQFLIFAKTVFFSQINLIKSLWLKSEKITFFQDDLWKFPFYRYWLNLRRLY